MEKKAPIESGMALSYLSSAADLSCRSLESSALLPKGHFCSSTSLLSHPQFFLLDRAQFMLKPVHIPRQQEPDPPNPEQSQRLSPPCAAQAFNRVMKVILVTWHGIHWDVGLKGDRLLPIPRDQEDSQECYEAPEGGGRITEIDPWQGRSQNIPPCFIQSSDLQFKHCQVRIPGHWPSWAPLGSTGTHPATSTTSPFLCQTQGKVFLLINWLILTNCRGKEAWQLLLWWNSRI